MNTVYDSLEWWYLKGRGWVGVVMYDGTFEHCNPAELTGKEVTVDGHKFVCKGVDMHRHMIYPERPYRGVIGLLE